MPILGSRRASLRTWLCYVALALPLLGCQLFHSSDKLHTAEKRLPPLQPAPDALELEILFVERPVGDRLLGEPLWHDVDQILSLVDPPTQLDLERNGFRVGVVGSHPPAALQSMLQLKSDWKSTGTVDEEAPLSGNRLFIRSGMTSEVQVSPVYPECEITHYASHQSRQGESKTYSQARCQLRVSATRTQEGWARLDFLPEIQHGDERPRPTAGANEWEMIASQQSERLHKLAFSVMLNVGEMALVTARDEEGTLGQRFFIGPPGNDGVQRMLIVRLAHVGKKDQTSH
ncbi:MAG TPA: hypothetical protein VHB77_12110 [Planctomycetaceae bacterium]|nr:hypothetical protein [Planctomycetaceae bacterium]